MTARTMFPCMTPEIESASSDRPDGDIPQAPTLRAPTEPPESPAVKPPADERPPQHPAPPGPNAGELLWFW